MRVIMLNGKTKAGRVNKSEVVRQMAGKLPPGAKARQIADQIRAEHDIEVKPAFIRNVLAKANQPLKKVLTEATKPEPMPDPAIIGSGGSISAELKDRYRVAIRLARAIDDAITIIGTRGVREVVEAALA